jgi:hypothetical protein
MKWAPPDECRVRHVAGHLRRQDAVEVFCSHGMQPAEAVIESWKNSPDCRCIEGDDGEPVGVCGVARGGVIWLLATDGLLATPSHRRQFIKGAKQWVDGLIADGAGPLHNWALAKNTRTLRWLRSLGFCLAAPAPMGPCGELFCYFERRA